MKPHLIKNYDGTYRVADQITEEWSAKNKTGDAFEIKSSKTRNYLFLRKYFGMLNIAFQNQEQYPTVKRLREAVQVQAGYCETIYYLDGTTALKAMSISFGSMKQEEFEKLYSDVLNIILAHFGFGEEFELELIMNFG